MVEIQIRLLEILSYQNLNGLLLFEGGFYLFEISRISSSQNLSYRKSTVFSFLDLK